MPSHAPPPTALCSGPGLSPPAALLWQLGSWRSHPLGSTHPVHCEKYTDMKCSLYVSLSHFLIGASLNQDSCIHIWLYTTLVQYLNRKLVIIYHLYASFLDILVQCSCKSIKEYLLFKHTWSCLGVVDKRIIIVHKLCDTIPYIQFQMPQNQSWILSWTRTPLPVSWWTCQEMPQWASVAAVHLALPAVP